MKYTASMFLYKDKILIFTIELGEFATCDEAKAVIEKHKETIDFCDFHMEAEYNVFKIKDDNDDDPETAYSVDVSNEEQDKMTALHLYVNNLNDIETVAYVFDIEHDCALEKELNDLCEEYQLLNSQSNESDQSPKQEGMGSRERLFEKYKDRINELVY